MYTLYFEDSTFESFQETINYYEYISEALADKFEIDFWKTIEKMKNNPKHFQIRYKNVRVAFTETFSFGIHFFIDKDKIVVIDLFHTSQDFEKEI